MYSKRLFEQQLHRWNIKKIGTRPSNTKLVNRIRDLYNRNLSHSLILWVLNDFEGYNLSDQQLRRLRLHPLVRLLYHVPNTKERQAEVRLAVRSEVASEQVVRYGRQYMQTALRNKGILVSQSVYIDSR
jgi:hypothetical protein